MSGKLVNMSGEFGELSRAILASTGSGAALRADRLQSAQKVND
jgi:hypothetical protein